MVQNTIARNIANLQDLGDVSYELARPILRQVPNPEQLRSLELNSPQIAANDAEIWKSFLNRDIPNWRDKIPQPNNPAFWRYEVYCKLKEREEEERQQQEEQLRQAMMKHDQTKESKKALVLDSVIQEDVKSLPARVDGVANPLARLSNNRRNATYAPALRNAKNGQQIIRALRKQSKQAIQAKSLAKPFGATPIAPPNRSQSTTQHTAKMTMTMFQSGESKGERSLRLALEKDKRQKTEAEQRKKIKEVTRQERAKEGTTKAPLQTYPPAPTKAQTTPPPRRPTPPKEAYLTPPPNPHLPQPGDSPRPRPSPESRTASPFKPGTVPFRKPSTPPMGPDPAALERKSSSPIPVITLNDEGEKPKIPVYTLPASCRRPVSIFAPKVKKPKGRV